MKPLFVSPRGLELYIAGDGQRFTDLIRSWANVYLRRCGASNFSINGVSWRPDGGVDGLIDDNALNDPLSWLVAKTVMQFKAGTIALSRAKNELLSEAPNGQERIRDKVAEGFRVAWFVGRALVDQDRRAFEDALAEAVSEINPQALRPLVIDLNRLAELLSRTPAVAMQVSNNPGLFMTSDAALKATPHSFLPKFVPGSGYVELQKDIVDFLMDEGQDIPIKYLSGEPGIGKSRSILEAVESSDELAGTICYFPNPAKIDTFFTLANQESWRGSIIVDDYIGDAQTLTPISQETVPNGIKVILIGHSFQTNRRSDLFGDELRAMTEEEILSALQATFMGLQEFRIREAIHMSRDNIRLARLICNYYRENPQSEGIDAKTLGQIVSLEVSRLPSGRETLLRLALVPNLMGAEFEEFCELVEIDVNTFRTTCREVSQRSGLIQFHDYVTYVGSPAVAQWALRQLWIDEPELGKKILSDLGSFGERILVSINKLAPSEEKEEMLGFFRLPTAKLSLTDLTNLAIGNRFLTLLTSDPETYLPILHRLIMESVGSLESLPYEGPGVGRRDLIWKLRDLAQFPEHFVMAEEIVYALAKEEVRSAYTNDASYYWVTWFSAWFDFTTYSYEKRLDLLASRIKNGSEIDQMMSVKALANPFPQVGTFVPSKKVGGRLAPPELNFIHRSQQRTALDRIPRIVELLLQSESQKVVSATAKMLLDYRFRWLEIGALEQFLKMSQSPHLPDEARIKLIADTRAYIDLGVDRKREVDKHIEWMHEQHRKLLAEIDDPDDMVTVFEVAERGMWRGDEPGSAPHAKLVTLVKACLSKPELFDKALGVLSEPSKSGGGTFGKLLGPEVTDAMFKMLLDVVRSKGFSQFTYSAIREAARDHQSRQHDLMNLARELEPSSPRTALATYQLFGDETYFREGTRILAETEIPAGLFQSFFLGSTEDLSKEKFEFFRAVLHRAKSGEKEACELAGSIAGELARHHVDDALAFELGMFAIDYSDSDHQRNSLTDWSDIALWLYPKFPEEVLSLAASREQSEFSEATRALAEIAKLNPKEVLDSLVPKLRTPYEPPFLFDGALLHVINVIPVGAFREWLELQEPKVLSTIAGSLPKPYLKDGNAVVPDITRAFWEVCTSEAGKAYEDAHSHFGAHTFNTGVYGGYGVDLFSERVLLGKKLLNDTNPAIREWAEDYVKQSEHMLEDAKSRSELDKAQRATED